MYFATNPADKRFCGTVIQAFLKLSEAFPDMRMHALVDAAFDEDGFAQFARAFGASAVPVYADSIYSGGLEFGPHLLEIDTTGAKAAQVQIEQLLTLRGNRPMLSLWITELDAATLATRLQPFVSAQLADGSCYMLRFADTRILHSLMTVLSPQQCAHFIPDSTQVWMPARDGQFIKAINEAGCSATPMTQLLLSPAQFNALMGHAEADAIIDRMTEDGAAAYAHTTGADLHQFVTEQMQRASKYHITQTPDLVTYCELAWTMGPAFDEDENVNFALLQVTPSNRLAKVIPAVPQSSWDALEAKHQKRLQQEH